MLACEVTGEGSPLVLLHGLGTNRGIWRRVAPLLAARRQVVAADLPGFGESPPTGPGFELDRVADEIAAGLRERVGAPYALLGSSLGGALALLVASRHPDDVEALVLSAPAGLNPRSGAAARAVGLIGRPVFGARRALGPALAGNPAARRLLFWGAIADPGGLESEEALAMLEAPRQATRINEALAAVLRVDLRPALASLETRLGVIWGEHDGVVPISTLNTIRELAPTAIVETIRHAAHIPQIERPEQFAGAVERLLGAITDS